MTERNEATVATPAVEAEARPDDELVARLRAGDERAFADLVRREHAALVRLARAFVADLDAAEDVVQEAWLAVVRGIDRFEGRSSLRTWLSRIVTYRARSRGSRDRRSVPFSALAEHEAADDAPLVDPARFHDAASPFPGHWSDPPAPWGEGERAVLGEELQRLVAHELDALPPAQALVMRLRDVAGWSSEEVCDALEISAGNQRVLLHRARSRVRAAIERYERDADV